MAKIKHTKNEMKAQKEALNRFERFLPMLLLKKQQLQAEIQHITIRIEEKEARVKQIRGDLDAWVSLFSEPIDLRGKVSLGEVKTDEGNIAGVTIPVLVDAQVVKEDVDLFATPPWIDDAMSVMGDLMHLRLETDILEEQRRLVTEELRTTSQRVNLFEKVKIPECRENIRTIKIFLGDEQTASVVRGKFAKKLTEARKAAEA